MACTEARPRVHYACADLDEYAGSDDSLDVTICLSYIQRRYLIHHRYSRVDHLSIRKTGRGVKEKKNKYRFFLTNDRVIYTS